MSSSLNNLSTMTAATARTLAESYKHSDRNKDVDVLPCATRCPRKFNHVIGRLWVSVSQRRPRAVRLRSFGGLGAPHSNVVKT